MRIKTTAKQSTLERFCWYVIPEIIIGVPKYDQGACIAYVMDTLQKNGFQVRYFHPNTVFISWDHWVPTYVRTEIKKKTGININEYGEKIEDEKDEETNEYENTIVTKGNSSLEQINSYKPSAKLVYSEDLLSKLENKMS